LVAFISTVIIGVAGVVGALLYGRRRPVGAPVSWGQALAAAVFSMFMLLWWYAVIPHQWLFWCDGQLGWTTTKVLATPTGNQPLTITYQTLRDLVAVVIYGIGIGLQIMVWAVWNDRGKRKPAPVPASRYGRPLVRKG
jgi:hypothetical protein